MVKILSFDSSNPVKYSDYTKFYSSAHKIEEIHQWIINTIVFVVAGGQSYWLTKNFDRNGKLTICPIKNIYSSLSEKIKYIDENEKTISNKSLKKIILDNKHDITCDWYEFVPYSPIKEFKS